MKRFKDILTEEFYAYSEIADQLADGKTMGSTSDGDYWELNGEAKPQDVAELVREGNLSGENWTVDTDEGGADQYNYDDLDEEAIALVLALDGEEVDAFQADYTGDHHYGDCKCYEYDGSEYAVYAGEDEVRYAIEQYVDGLVDDGCLWNAEDYIKEDYFDDWLDEGADNYASEQSDEELIEFLIDKNYRYNLEDYAEFTISEEDYDPEEHDGQDYEDFKSENEDDKDYWELTDRSGAEEAFADDYKDSFNNSLEYVLEFMRVEDLVKEHPDCIDTDAVVDDCVNSAGDCLASYDGQELEQAYNGTYYYIYRIN